VYKRLRNQYRKPRPGKGCRSTGGKKDWSRTRRCFIATAFQICFRICHNKVQESQGGLELNGRHQLPVYADDVNLLVDNIDTIKESTETLIDARKEVGLEVNAEKTSIDCCLTRIQGKIMA
jgi:hypothetical protein